MTLGRSADSSWIVRDAGWLTAERVAAWSRVLGVLTILTAVVWLALSHGGLDTEGKPVGGDFLAFWTASRLALDGHPAAAYDPLTHLAAQHAVLPALAGRPGYQAFLYPPTFLLICLPFALLPYLVSLGVWLVSTFAVLFAALRRILPQRSAIVPIAAFPSLLTNCGHGQNGFLSGACFAGGLVLAGQRPFCAGMCLGVLVFKPHLLAVIPLVMMAAGRWWVVAGTATSACLLLGLSYAVFGAAAWHAFLALAPAARSMLEQGRIFDISYVRSVFAAVRVMHGGIGLAYILQAPVTLCAVALACASAWRRPGVQAELALAVAAAMLASPYLQDYDLVCLAVPMAWLAASALQSGWLPYEKAVLFAAYATPLLSRLLATGPGAMLGPLVLAVFLALIARRAWGHPAVRT
jgi:hypothetical protein